MENPAMETSSLFTSGIKRHVKDRISRTGKLNVSLASKIKTKILNNSSIFKISLKHNNRALAQALSREKENSRRVTTEKVLLQKEVEKLNFENAFLRLKLNNLNKKLIEIEALMNNNLITAIEMSTLSEFHQSPFLLPSSKKKRASKECKLMRLPFARVPLTSNDDDDDDDDDKEKVQYDDNTTAKTSSDIPFSVSTRQSLSNQSPKNSLVSEIKNAPSVSHGKKPSPNKITERKKHVSSWESNNPSTDSLHLMDLDQQQISSPELNWSKINDHTNETNIKMQRNIQCLPDSSESICEPVAEYMNPFQGSDDFQLQKTVYDADMDLTAGEVSKIVTVSTGTKNRSNKKSNDCKIKTFRKVKDSSSEKKREKSKRQFKNSSDIDIEEKIENGPEKISVVLEGKVDSEDPDFIFSTEQVTQLNILKKVTHHNGFDQDDRESTQHNKKKKRIHVTNEQEETNSFSQSSDKFQQENKFDTGQSSLAYHKSKASRETFVIHKLEKGNLFPNQNSENLGVTSEFQTANLSTKDNGNLCDYKTQNMSYLKKHVTGMQLTQQNQSIINEKLRQKVNRRTEIISESNQVYGDSAEDVHGPEKDNFSFQTQEDKETISGNLEVSDEFQKPALSTIGNGSLCDCEIQNVLDLQKQITNVYPVQQNESKVNKNLRQKVNRKTEIISEMNHLDNGKNVYCPEKGNSSFLTQKDKEIVLENLKDPSEFQTPALSTKDSRNIYDYETQNVLGVKKHIQDMQPTCQNESKIDKKLRQKVCRKTEIISEINQVYENNNKDIHDPEKDNLLSLTQKVKEVILENLEDLNEFQITDPSTGGNTNLCHYETQNILGVKKHVTDMPLAKQNESKIKLRQKVKRKTEIILEMNRVNEFKKKGVQDPEERNFFSLSQTDKETVSENLEVTSELQTAYLSTQNNGNLYDYETQNVMDLKKHVTDMQPAQQNESKTNKKLRKKVNRKTEIISERYPIYEDNDKDMHDQESYTKGLGFQVNKSKQRLECQGIISGYSMQIDSNEKENCDQISNLYKLVKKHGKESSGKTNISAKGKNKSIFQLPDSLQTPVSLESGLKYITDEADSDPGKQIEPQENRKQSTTTLNEKKKNTPFVEVIKEGECQVRKVNKTASKSKKRKIFVCPSSDSHEVMQVISDTDQAISVESQQANEVKNLENEKVVRMKPDFYTKAFESLSQVYSPNIQDSSFNSVHEDSVPLRISSSKNLIIRKSFALESSPIFQVTDDVHEKMKGMKFKVSQRTQKSEIGGRTLQDLTNTSFVSNNTAKAENKSENSSLELPSRRRRCTPLYLKEPNLKRKMRR
ncbi:shugoshin 2 [Hyaena hyaena]|uniref:shugoshin 2 n=1 Tax=Hyaena hyaena TaxID=95912 RepID=UPI0019215909|nr:shugoshin 2 [Hyaena hyaena]